jgi:hypothetical protein
MIGAIVQATDNLRIRKFATSTGIPLERMNALVPEIIAKGADSARG